MHRKYFFVILTAAGLCLLLILFFFFDKPPSNPPGQVSQSANSPYSASIGGVGIVEPASGNIYIGNPFNRVVKKIHVSVNDRIKKGDILFQLDHPDLLATLDLKISEYETALAHLNKLVAFPRKEDLSAAEEGLKKAEAELNESKTRYEMASQLPHPRALSQEEHNNRFYRYRIAEAEYNERKVLLEKVQSGAWKPELEIAQQEVKQAKASVDAIETEISRMYIKSPIHGTVLQIKIHEGETAGSDPYKTLMILGTLAELNLRVSIDQYDIPLTNLKASAIAFRQGDHSTEFPLKFLYVEPFMVPKMYLTNSVGEKVDTQVLEIVYQITKKDPSLYIGEQLDVFIDTIKD